MSAAKPRVALVSAPTLSSVIPSFQLALLKPTLERAGWPVETFSLFLSFARMLGPRANDTLAMVYPCLVGEWLWSRAAFGDFAREQDYVDRFRDQLVSICRLAGIDLRGLKKIRRQVTEQFLDWALEEIDWSGFAVVGFTVCFQQMLASLALARRIKERHPQVRILLGGATFEDDIALEIAERCEWVDAVHCGDADLTLPTVVEHLSSGRSLRGLPGVVHREQGRVEYAGRAPNLEQLDLAPVPDFDEFFTRRAELGLQEGEGEVMLPIETARGCWYGMKNHCTFCGLNRSGMAFRARSPQKVLEMLEALSRRYGVIHFNAIDNILAPEYATGLFGELAAAKTDWRLHYEIRPTVARAQLKAMRLGGLVSVQPGVESFSTRVLSLMKKHTTGVKNLELLKWATYYGIDNQYNVLHGFAGERDADYREQAALMRKIPHLQPPYAFARARADRGSPMHEEPGAHGVERLKPAPCYRWIYPPSFELKRVSYFFDDRRRNVAHPKAYAECEAVVDAWREAWHGPRRPTLTFTRTLRSLTVHDRRAEEEQAWRFDDAAAAVYEACADAVRRAELLPLTGGDAKALDAKVEEFLREGLMVELDGKLLALALPENPNW